VEEIEQKAIAMFVEKMRATLTLTDIADMAMMGDAVADEVITWVEKEAGLCTFKHLSSARQREGRMN
jgi:hypothetical protein